MPAGVSSAETLIANPVDWSAGGGEREAVDLLRRLGLIDTDSIVNGDLMVVDVSRRNRNFAALRSDGPQYLVKTAENPDRTATLTHEAAVYAWLLSQHPAVAEHLVPFAAAGQGYLVVEWRPGSRNLREVHLGRAGFSRRCASEVGRVLATLHSIPLTSGDRLPDGPAAHGTPPWILSLDAVPLRILRELSLANHEHIRMIQASAGTAGLLDGVASSWEPTALCHNDVRWDNCVITPAPGSLRTRRLSIVDWELASVGDSCWDVGCFFAEYIAFWASSLAPPSAAEAEPDIVGVPSVPIESMQPAIGNFWRSYARHNGAVATRPRMLVQAVQMMGVRLLQTALEQGQRTTQPTGVSVTLVQLGLNVLESPEESARGLLGLDPYA
ncbi:MAG: aminoglycoside phosphotransferase family protein [Homoserinimonas sp.]